jgi:hypothetical protein
MASGISSPWGMSPQMVSGLNNSLDKGNKHLTGELGMTSVPVYFDEFGLVSPLTEQNKSYYNAFGRKRSSLKKLDNTISYLKKLR